jgi:hypothetical protein
MEGVIDSENSPNASGGAGPIINSNPAPTTNTNPANPGSGAATQPNPTTNPNPTICASGATTKPNPVTDPTPHNHDANGTKATTEADPDTDPAPHNHADVFKAAPGHTPAFPINKPQPVDDSKQARRWAELERQGMAAEEIDKILMDPDANEEDDM